VPRGNVRADVYEKRVYCPTCAVYFNKPFPRWCLCCVTLVRHVKARRPYTRVYDYNYGMPPQKTKWVKKDILAAQKAGKL
jgi:hypothetical protein